MSFLDLKNNIKESYRTPDDIVGGFYIPLLSNAKKYDRAVGFFSSSVLIELSRGLINLVRNGGKMRLITSPKLQEQDIQAIKEGYDRREIIDNAIMREWKEPRNYIEEERLNFLSHMIEDGFLDIKIAFKKPIGLYHEKIGILTDEGGNTVAFTGSLNESEQAISLNFESIDAFTSWNEPSRTNKKVEYFEESWNNATESLEVIEFPKVAREKLQTYKKERYNENIDSEEEKSILKKEIIKKEPVGDPGLESEVKTIEKPYNVPMIPIDDKFTGLYDYQKDAIDEWASKNYRGIFDMATGTGKTFTGLGAITRLYNDLNGKLAVVICCPYIHLVDQWVEDIKAFNIDPIIGYGTSTQNWKMRLKDAVSLFIRSKKPNFFCFISTNDTFRSSIVQEQIKRLKNNCLFISDEAHNFGAESLSKSLPDFEYRLALSATLERHGDTIGTQKLYDYFGEKCIEYPLDRAIRERKLTKYFYYPHIVTLDIDELEDYRKLSFELKKYYTPKGMEMCEAAKKILIKRARILASAKNKIPELRRIILEQGDDKEHNLLIYCGDSTVKEAVVNGTTIYDEKQILVVAKLLGQELNMDVKKFTSEESGEERQEIKNGFVNKDYQAIVAIRCLDEGVNIPSIKTAYILASTTNPKQYIQRRGRVLRKAEGKEFSIIHDFIVLPCEVEYLYNYSKEEFNIESGLIKRELARLKEFAESAENSSSLYQEFIDPLAGLFTISENDEEFEYV